MSYISFFANRGIQAVITPDGELNLRGLSKLNNDTKIQVLQYAKKNKQAIISALNCDNTPDLSLILPEHVRKYKALWNRAWMLAEYVDGNAPYEDRIKKLPSLNRIVEKMRRLENRLPTPTRDHMFPARRVQSQSPVRFVPKKAWTPDTCPAKCKQTGLCYGETYFNHKPGTGTPCQGSACPWMK